MPDPTTPAPAGEKGAAAVERSPDGRRTIACPGGVTAGELRCLKLYNPDPQAAWDFWLMVIIQRVGPIAKVTQLIPLADGGYRQFVARTSHRNVESVTNVKTFESKSDSFGFVRIEKSKARDFYAELRESLFAVQSTVQDFDAEGRPVSVPEPRTDPSWPDLPGDGEGTAPLPRLAPEVQRQPFDELGAVIRFPTAVATGDGDYEVADGEVLPGAASALEAARAQPGVRIEVTQREGVPAEIRNDYFLVDDAGEIRRLYGDRCVQKTHVRILEIIQEERDRGLFRSRIKLTMIRRRLRVDELIWEET